MSVKVACVDKKSLAGRKGIHAGDKILSINGNEINDFLDYRYYLAGEKLSLQVRKPNGRVRKLKIKKSEYDDIGLDFDSFIMDKERRCANKCIFCFIDQLPKGMRKSLYFKDDDTRLSFLFGNYITLTNISQREIDRIIKMKISPVNISVHTMNEELRVKMMGNKNAGKCLKYIKELADAGIEINTQLVLCPGVNDGEELKYSIEQLSQFYPSLQSIAAVPVGLTKYREGLYPLTPYTKETAAQVIDIIETASEEFRRKYGKRIVYASDEFYLKAGRDMPDADFYEDFSQLDNGVGLWANLKEEFLSALENLQPTDRERKLTLVTGVSSAPLIKELVDRLLKKCYNFRINTVPVVNEFFGSHIDVAGLVTGRDIIKTLKCTDIGETLVIPKVMLRFEEDLFLDDISVSELEKELNTKVTTVSNDGYELLNVLTGDTDETCCGYCRQT